MTTGTELRERIRMRQTALSGEQRRNDKSTHVQPCENNFDYSSLTKGSKEGLQLILDEMVNGF